MKKQHALSKIEFLLACCILIAVAFFVFRGSEETHESIAGKPELIKDTRAALNLNDDYFEEQSEEEQEYFNSIKEINEDVADRISIFRRDDVADGVKQEVYQELMNMPYSQTFPVLAYSIHEYAQTSVDYPNCESHIVSETCMALAVWSIQAKKPEDALEKNQFYLGLLEDFPPAPFMTMLILNSLSYNWTPDAGEPVSELLADDQIDIPSKTRAITLLLGKSELEHSDKIIELIEYSPLDDQNEYLSKALWHAKFYEMEPKFVELTFEAFEKYKQDSSTPMNVYGLLKLTHEYLEATNKGNRVDPSVIAELASITDEIAASEKIDHSQALNRGLSWWETYQDQLQ